MKNHMCGNSSFFVTCKKDSTSWSDWGGMQACMFWQKKRLSEYEWRKNLVKDVFYVLELMKKLLSVGKLQGKGLVVPMKSNEYQIYHSTKGLIIQTNMTTNIIFVLLLKPQPIKE